MCVLVVASVTKNAGIELLKAGARRLIIGTRATPEFLAKFPKGQVMVALDHRGEVVVDQGWANSTGETIWDRAERLAPFCSGFLTTFVEGEGCLEGMNIEAVKNLKQKLPGQLTVAGGIKETSEVAQISALGVDAGWRGGGLYKGLVDPGAAVVESIKFDGAGLVPTVVQDQSGQVLMMAFSSPESLKIALSEGRGVYYSRSRQEIWRKGETSGSVQELISCRADCDRDCLLFTVRQSGSACHNNTYSCFGQASSDRRFSLPELFDIIKDRKQSPRPDLIRQNILPTGACF